MKKLLGARTLIFPTPTWVVATYDEDGRPNAATIAWGGICCSLPPCIGISLRKANHTYAALVKRRAFTVNVPSQEQLKFADFMGMTSGRDLDKFAASGLTAVRSEQVDAPFIEEFPLSLDCRIVQILELGLHTQFVGEVLEVRAEEAVLGDDGLPDMAKVQPILFAPETNLYYGVGPALGPAFQVQKLE